MGKTLAAASCYQPRVLTNDSVGIDRMMEHGSIFHDKEEEKCDAMDFDWIQQDSFSSTSCSSSSSYFSSDVTLLLDSSTRVTDEIPSMVAPKPSEDDADKALVCIQELLAVVAFGSPPPATGLVSPLQSHICSTPHFHDKARTSPTMTVPSESTRHTFDEIPGDPSFSLLETSDRACSSPPLGPPSILKRVSSYGSTDSTVMTTTTSTTSPPSPPFKRTVSFHKLTIREYDVTLSDHPSCSYGPPIQLGWEFHDELELYLDDYEHYRTYIPRRGRNDLLLSYQDRQVLLQYQAGYSNDEITHVMNEVDRVKRERQQTYHDWPVHTFVEEVVEGMVHLFKGLFQRN